MRLAFQYEHEDFSAEKRGRWPRGRVSQRVAVTALILIASILAIVGASTYLVVSSSFAWCLAAVLPLSLIVVLLRALGSCSINEAGSPEAWALNPLSHSPVSFEIATDGFRMSTPRWRHMVAWRAVNDVYENEHQFRVVVKNESYLIPKRCLATLDEIARFKGLLRENLQKEFVQPA